MEKYSRALSSPLPLLFKKPQLYRKKAAAPTAPAAPTSPPAKAPGAVGAAALLEMLEAALEMEEARLVASLLKLLLSWDAALVSELTSPELALVSDE